MARKRKTTTKTTKTAKSLQPVRSLPSPKAVESKPKEKVYSYQELAGLFGISKLKARAYFNMCKIDYDTKLTIKQARELFKKF